MNGHRSMTELVVDNACLNVGGAFLSSPLLVHRSPQASEQPAEWSLLEHRAALRIVVDHGGHDDRLGPLLLGKRVAFRRGPSLTRRRDRTSTASDSFGRADRRSQLHQGLIPIARPYGFERGVSPRLNRLWRRLGLGGLSRHHPTDVAVNAGHGLAERDAGHGGSGVRPNAGQRQKFVVR